MTANAPKKLSLWWTPLFVGGGFALGSCFGGLLFSSEAHLVGRIGEGAVSVLFAPVLFPLAVATAYDVFPIWVRAALWVGLTLGLCSLSWWLMARSRLAAALLSISSTMIGIPNVVVFVVAMGI